MPFVTWLKRHLVVLAGLLTLGYLLLPNIVVTVFSFNKPKGRFNYEWQQFSTDAWKHPCGVADMCGSLSLSLQIAVWATLGATVLGTMIAFALVRYRFRARGAVNSLIFLPMAMPEVVMAASLLTLFLNMGASWLLDDPHRPHHVLPQLRRHRRQGPRDVDGPASGAGRAGPVRRPVPDLPQGHPAHRGTGYRRGRAARLRAVLRRFHHHQFQRGLDGHLPPCSCGGSAQRGTPVQINVIGTAMFVIAVLFVLAAMAVGNRRNRRQA